MEIAMPPVSLTLLLEEEVKGKQGSPYLEARVISKTPLDLMNSSKVHTPNSGLQGLK